MEFFTIPVYLENFICTGSACRLTCCRNWTIAVDEGSYNKYMSCPDEALKKIFKDSLVRFEKADKYARIKLGNDGRCPFLNDKSLCRIQLTFGEAWLPAACEYPRRAFNINGEWEMALMLSCPEAARLALFGKDKMRFTQRALAVPKKHTDLTLGYPYPLFKSIRDLIIAILQNRSFRFHERLMLTGIFIRRAADAGPDETVSNIPSFERYMQKDSTRCSLSSLAPDSNAQFGLISKIIGEIASRPSLKEYAELLMRCQKGLEKFAGNGESEYGLLMNNYSVSAQKWDYIFENYFVNEVFRSPLAIAGLTGEQGGSPSYSPEALWEKYMELCAQYLMLSFHFACIYALKNELETNDITDIVNLFSRAAFSHDRAFTGKITSWLRRTGYEDVGAVAGLIYF